MQQFDDSDYVAHIPVVAKALRNVNDLRREPYYREVREESSQYVRVAYQEIEVFKEKKHAPKYLNELVFGPGNCMLGLLSGMEYVVFQTKETGGFVALCSGSFGFFSREGKEIKPRLKEFLCWLDSR